MKLKIKNFLAFLIGCAFALLILEVFLRVYDPFGFSVRGQEIILDANRQEVFINKDIQKLDSIITRSTNNIGFRGPDMPDDIENRLSLFVVGGSTTQCFYSSDGKDWPALLANKLKPHYSDLWLNNAGLDGHTTFGHQILLDDYIIGLKPKIVLFYAGINDVGVEDMKSFDKDMMPGRRKGMVNKLAEASELVNVGYNLLRAWWSKQHQLSHDIHLNLKEIPALPMTEEEHSRLVRETTPMIDGYAKRLQGLINTCLEHDITPVFITQPVLFGEGIDSLTGADLENMKIWPSANGKAVWQLLQLYNQKTLEVAKKNNCGTVDVAAVMTKDSRYYYDFMHYSNEGCEIVSDIVFDQLLPILKNIEKKNALNMGD